MARIPTRTLNALTDNQLGALILRAEELQDRRKLAKLRAQKCECDRYTCYRCQQIAKLE